jgi:hypothetical protein
MSDFPTMLDRMLETPKKLAMNHPEKVVDFIIVDYLKLFVFRDRLRLMMLRGKSTTRPCSRPTTPRVTTGCVWMSGSSWQWREFLRRWLLRFYFT